MSEVGTDIAIIGMALRVPGANTVEGFWRNLRGGVESIRTLTDDELLAAGVSSDTLRDPNYVKRAAPLDGLASFDANFFGFGRQDAAVMDPQHRHFIECAWEAIESSARPVTSASGPVSVFAGCGMGSYFYSNVCSHQALVDQVGMFLLRHTGNDKDFLATRLSHLLDLRGPSVNVQTACSTSLVAVHMACQSLLNGESDMALAGGVTIELPHNRGYVYRDGEILSPDGHCRAFDHRAAGTVFGSGVGVVVLRRLADAIADGDPIRAVIKATAINNDGASKASYLAPSVKGQSEAVVEAQTLAGITADTVQYIECHGTGTRLGDPIEIEALTQAFRHSTPKKGFCFVGSVKSNIGHLDTAAGVVGLIKTALALENGEIPPTLGYEKPNSAIDFAATPFVVCDRLTPWPETRGPRRAAVNSLGVGGTNAHAILEQAPIREKTRDRPQSNGPHFLVLSAKTSNALVAASQRLADYLVDAPQTPLQDVAATLLHGRTHFVHRRVVAAPDRAKAIANLRETNRSAAPQHMAIENTSGAVFLFPGGGAQSPGMARALYRDEPGFRRDVDEGLSYLPAAVATEIRGVWLQGLPDAAKKFLNPALQLPAILIVEVALARLWIYWGIKPKALIGHSMGENAAACISGVLSFKNAVELVHLRGRLFNEIAPGGMLSVPLSEKKLRARLPDNLDLASVNAPDMCVVSGDNAALDAFRAALSADEIESIRVPIEIAAHSRMLDPILERFEAFLATLTLAAPTIPIVSNLTGTWLTEAQARDPKYWRMHLNSPVKFANGLGTLSQDATRVFIEVGPGRTLSSLAKAQGVIEANQVINSLPHADDESDDRMHFYASLGRAWATGLPVPLERSWLEHDARRVQLPTYPFQHETFWIARDEQTLSTSVPALKHKSIDDWFAAPTWVRSPLLSSLGTERSDDPDRRWLVFSDGSALARRIVRGLGKSVVVAENGATLKVLRSGHWRFAFASPNQHREFIDELDKAGFKPTDVIYCCDLAGPLGKLNQPFGRSLKGSINKNFLEPTYAVRALGGLVDPVNFSVVTRGLAQISAETIEPVRATVLGPVLVAPREMPHIRSRCIDIGPAPIGRGVAKLLRNLLSEMLAEPAAQVVALRSGARWVRRVERLNVPTSEHVTSWRRDGGVYVITGGLGDLGLEFAEHLARSSKVKLALLARGALPPEADWDDVLRVLQPESTGARRIQRIRAIRALGSQVSVYSCDIADEQRVGQTLKTIRADFGKITGVIHAAGVMDDEPIEQKSEQSMLRVLNPKIAGAVHLDRLIDEPLDVFILFSSVSSFIGLPGQVDYAAANAFLDAFAIDRASRAPGRTVAINWNAWRQIGMAARADTEQQHGRAPSSLVAHPALDGYSDDPGAGRSFVTDFSIERHWLLSEHKIKNGQALLSGTTFVELARAAFAVGRPPEPIEIRDLEFLTPFQVADGMSRRLVTEIAVQGAACEITMRTAGDDPRSPPHVVGDVSTYHDSRPSAVDLDHVSARCPEVKEARRGGIDDQHLVDFGPRWETVRSIRSGNGEALLDLELRPSFVPDLEHYQLHPAMLDFATGGAQWLIPGFDPKVDFYVPVGYGRLVLFEPMPKRFFSHVRLRAGMAKGQACFDVTLITPDGTPFCEISDFEMKRIDSQSSLVDARQSMPAKKVSNTSLQKLLRHAIEPQDGLAAFDRIMAHPGLVQCVASSMDLEVWGRELAAQGGTLNGGGETDGAGVFARPELASAYKEASTDTEKLLERIWSELLGIRSIGVEDDFFQLGGHSLHAVRLFAAIRKQFGLSLPLSTLFANASIRLLAALIEAQAPKKPRASGQADETTAAVNGQQTDSAPQPTAAYSSVVPIQPVGNGPAFYCAAGMGGNPLNLRALALEMGIDQPFYGLQPQGLDGVSKLHQTVPEMAAHYIGDIKRQQPVGPYFLGGYSGGGVVAYEMARQLTAAGERIGCLVFLDSVAPDIQLPSAAETAGRRLADIRKHGLGHAAWALKHTVRRRADQAATVARRPLRRWFPYYYRLENIADTWNEAFARYHPPAYEGEAVLFRASSGMVLGVDIGPSNGWDRIILGALEINTSPGDHASMCEQPHVRVLARRLRTYLRKCVRTCTAAAGEEATSTCGPQAGRPEAEGSTLGPQQLSRSLDAVGI